MMQRTGQKCPVLLHKTYKERQTHATIAIVKSLGDKEMKKNRWMSALLSAVMLLSGTVNGVYAQGKPQEATVSEEAETLDKDPKDIPSNEASIEGFVVRLYRIALGREADNHGFAYWTNGIKDGSVSGCTAVRGFFLSEEFTKKGLSDTAFLETLYKTVLNRTADSAGLAYWKERLAVHMSRTWVMNGFLNSQEFTNLCAAYGVTRGNAPGTGNYRDRNYSVTAFVSRMYTKVLGRNAEVSGVESWCTRILRDGSTGADLAVGFFMSPEFVIKNVSNTEYVKTCYRAILDREGSASEVNSWTSALATKSRKEVLAGFVNSAEFNNLCNRYGINRGTLVLGGWKQSNGRYYYYKSDGSMAKKEILTIGGKRYGFTAKGVWIGEKSESYLDAYQKAITLVNSITNSSMTEDQKLRAAFGVFKNFTQKNPWIPHDNSEGWVERYANHCFDTHIGNCMSYAACFGIMAQVLGVEEVYCCNNWGHGWCEIGGLIYDPEAALHSSMNFYARSFDEPGAGMKYREALNRNEYSSAYVKL